MAERARENPAMDTDTEAAELKGDRTSASNASPSSAARPPNSAGVTVLGRENSKSALPRGTSLASRWANVRCSEKGVGASIAFVGEMVRTTTSRVNDQVQNVARKLKSTQTQHISGFKLALKQRQAQRLKDQQSKATFNCIKLICFAVIYVTAGGGLFAGVEGWSYADGIYFATVTLTTVGYGDLNPQTGAGRFLAILYCLFGVSTVIASLRGLTMQLANVASERALIRATERKPKLVPTGAAGDEEMANGVDVSNPRGKGWRIKAGLLIVVFCVLQCASAAVFVAFVPGLNFLNALYHCWVTASTLGYGAFAADFPTTTGMRAWMTCHVFFSSLFLAVVVAEIDKARAVARAAERRADLLSAPLDGDLLAKLDRDGNGVDKLEFVIGMLTSLDVVAWRDVEPFLEMFDKMDADGSGHLDMADIKRLREERETKACLRSGSRNRFQERRSSIASLTFFSSFRKKSSETRSPTPSHDPSAPSTRSEPKTPFGESSRNATTV